MVAMAISIKEKFIFIPFFVKVITLNFMVAGFLQWMENLQKASPMINNHNDFGPARELLVRSC